MDGSIGVSRSFRLFGAEAPAHAVAWAEATDALRAASALDEKTGHLCYLSVLAALGLESGMPFHVVLAKGAGATRDEVISAVLVGLQTAGHLVISCLPAAIDAYDA